MGVVARSELREELALEQDFRVSKVNISGFINGQSSGEEKMARLESYSPAEIIIDVASLTYHFLSYKQWINLKGLERYVLHIGHNISFFGRTVYPRH